MELNKRRNSLNYMSNLTKCSTKKLNMNATHTFELYRTLVMDVLTIALQDILYASHQNLKFKAYNCVPLCCQINYDLLDCTRWKSMFKGHVNKLGLNYGNLQPNVLINFNSCILWKFCFQKCDKICLLS